MGLFLGGGIAFLVDRLDPRMRSREGSESAAEAPVIGAIPARTRLSEQGPPGLLATNRSPAGLAYQILRVSFVTAMSERGARSVIVTSPHGGEGKTSVTANLAKGLARAGSRVILIERRSAQGERAHIGESRTSRGRCRQEVVGDRQSEGGSLQGRHDHGAFPARSFRTRVVRWTSF